MNIIVFGQEICWRSHAPPISTVWLYFSMFKWPHLLLVGSSNKEDVWSVLLYSTFTSGCRRSGTQKIIFVQSALLYGSCVFNSIFFPHQEPYLTSDSCWCGKKPSCCEVAQLLHICSDAFEDDSKYSSTELSLAPRTFFVYIHSTLFVDFSTELAYSAIPIIWIPQHLSSFLGIAFLF